MWWGELKCKGAGGRVSTAKGVSCTFAATYTRSACIVPRMLLPLLLLLGQAAGVTSADALPEQRFTAPSAGEATAVVRASCAGCAWRQPEHEAVVLVVSLDGVYSQHLVLVRGSEEADYRIAPGRVDAGPHRLTFARDATLSAAAAGAVSISRVDVEIAAPDTADGLALSMAPFLYARADTVGRFTDVPILMWYEVVPTNRGRQFRYSVIFTNEDGGTKTDRLMATWGRTTDIEYVYGVELGASGRVLSEEIQAAGHKYPAFEGRHDGRHPLLWVDTDNNMVAAQGITSIRYAPAAERFDLTNTSREAVMDAHPWSYRIAVDEMLREGKIEEGAAAGSGRIPDPREFTYVEACTHLRNATVSFSVRVRNSNGGERWYDSDRGIADFRIARTGCFRGAVPIPETAGHVTGLRVRAFSHPEKDSTEAPTVTLTRVNRVFVLGPDYRPQPSGFQWTGSVALPIDGDWRELTVR